MDTKDKVLIICEFNKMIESLKDSINEAGGSYENTINDIMYNNISALELLSKLCTNNIRFTFIK